VCAEKQQGTEFKYSDAGYCVLQLLLQELEQKPFEDVAQEMIFIPLSLNNTFFASPNNIAHYERKSIMATGYDENGHAIPGKYPQIPDLAASGLWSTPKELLIIAKEFVKACNGQSSLLKEKNAMEIVKPVEQFQWTGLGVFIGGENEIVSRGWGENGQSMMKINYRTGEIAVVMTNQNPGVDQSESGIEWLVNNQCNIQ
ncbi:MAG: beta-lactamase family protein, partial [Spirochaetales bacterium]|nr:beta-lactamase family protein [Spirochaetales bacterium]